MLQYRCRQPARVNVEDLKAGDHIYRAIPDAPKWTRATHHGIITEVPVAVNTFETVKVVHWGTDNGDDSVVTEITLRAFTLDATQELKRARYGEETRLFADGIYNYGPAALPAEKVVYRAKQILSQATNQDNQYTQYRLVYRNCEHLATYCKSGISISHQVQRGFDFTGVMFWAVRSYRTVQKQDDGNAQRFFVPMKAQLLKLAQQCVERHGAYLPSKAEIEQALGRQLTKDEKAALSHLVEVHVAVWLGEYNRRPTPLVGRWGTQRAFSAKRMFHVHSKV